MVHSGALPVGEYGLTAVPKNYSGVTSGSRDIIVEGSPSKQYVFFYTYRGILDDYSGVVYVPPGLSPSDFRDDVEVTPIEGQWYFVRGQ